ncbi:inward rectifier potassium channel 2-like isoform X2 [Choristoneura fumiferana]|uniref:inward rectifier potassium channel 2-like isoform X2 n=1 Tax=Choristoneura fumiferana TaxID=7141 RepID=UPI003D15DE0E
MAEALRKRCVEFDQDAKLVIPGVYHPRNKYIQHNSQKYKTSYRRAVFKNGEFNIPHYNSAKNFSILTTWFITMVQTRWRWTIINFTMAYILNWLFFGCLYWIIATGHGDFILKLIPQLLMDIGK